MKILIIAALLLMHGAALAQATEQPALSYTFGEIRYVDVDDGGDGFELGGSFQFHPNWFGVVSYSTLDFRNSVDVTSVTTVALRTMWIRPLGARSSPSRNSRNMIPISAIPRTV